MSKKYQVFISSTYEDLKDKRDTAIKTILKMNHIPIGMEMFNAEDEEQWQIIKRTIDSSDYYVLILGFRYGSVDKNGVSFTEREYDYAVKRKIPILSFLMSQYASTSPNIIDNNREKINKFRDKVQNNNKMASFWENKDQLASVLATSLLNQIQNKPRLGWVKAKENYMISNDIMKDKELDKLSGTWTSMGYNGLSNEIYRGKIEIHFDNEFGYRVTTTPNNGHKDDDWEVFTGSIIRSGNQFIMSIRCDETNERVTYSFMQSDIPVVKKEKIIILGVHLGFTRSKRSHAGIGILTMIDLTDDEVRKILGKNVNFKIDEDFKSGFYDYYNFDTP